MTNKRTIKLSLMIFSLIMLGNLAALSQKVDCSKQTDAELVLAVYARLKTQYPEQYRQINVSAANGVIKLEGWVTTGKIQKKIVSLVKKVKCVKNPVIDEIEVGKPGGCAPGQKECGGACISEKEACNVCLVDPMAPGCATTTQQNPPKKDQ